MTPYEMAVVGVIVLVLLPLGAYIGVEGVKILSSCRGENDPNFFTGLAELLIGFGLWVVFALQFFEKIASWSHGG